MEVRLLWTRETREITGCFWSHFQHRLWPQLLVLLKTWKLVLAVYFRIRRDSLEVCSPHNSSSSSLPVCPHTCWERCHPCHQSIKPLRVSWWLTPHRSLLAKQQSRKGCHRSLHSIPSRSLSQSVLLLAPNNPEDFPCAAFHLPSTSLLPFHFHVKFGGDKRERGSWKELHYLLF